MFWQEFSQTLCKIDSFVRCRRTYILNKCFSQNPRMSDFLVKYRRTYDFDKQSYILIILMCNGDKS